MKPKMFRVRFSSVGQTLLAASFVLAFCLPAYGQAESGCGDLRNHYGPYDYTNPVHRAEMLYRVEQFHFDAGVEALRGLDAVTDSEARLGGDIGYTLRAFPNHHRALYTMIRYNLEKVPAGAQKMRYTPECWLDRAKRFSPSDATVLMIEGMYYRKRNNLAQAKIAYETALGMAPRSAEINYNAGLLFVDLKEYDRAMEHAAKAYELGHPLPGLRNKLKGVGAWKPDQVANRPVASKQ